MHVLFDYKACSCNFVIYLMHDELKNIQIIELELFERTRCAIRRRLRRDELRYDRSKRVANRVGAEGDGHGATRRRARARARHRPNSTEP